MKESNACPGLAANLAKSRHIQSQPGPECLSQN